jgi:hypothetical protein
MLQNDGLIDDVRVQPHNGGQFVPYGVGRWLSALNAIYRDVGDQRIDQALHDSLRDNWIAFIEQSSLQPCIRSRWPDISRASIGPKFHRNSAHSRKLIVNDNESRNHFSVRMLFRDGLGSEAQ